MAGDRSIVTARDRSFRHNIASEAAFTAWSGANSLSFDCVEVCDNNAITDGVLSGVTVVEGRSPTLTVKNSVLFENDPGDRVGVIDSELFSGVTRLENNTLINPKGKGLTIQNRFSGVQLVNNQFLDHTVSYEFLSTPSTLTADFNQWASVSDDTAIGPNDLVVPPTLSPAWTGACGDKPYMTLSSPGIDQGDPAIKDWWDGSRSDIGAYGGPGACVPDTDNDGYPEQFDCDDTDAMTFVGANEKPYDGVDQDCDGNDWCDVDGDGYDSTACGGDDCDDSMASVNIGAPEIPYDGIDNDCDGDDACDEDGDGYVHTSCGGGDCDDTDNTVHPDADEIWYDDVDQDCDQSDDWDCDGDGHVPTGILGYTGTQPADDCNDQDATVYPGATDDPTDGVDSDCAGDDECDADVDGYDSAA
jgi:hypothetical protein